MTLAGVDKRIYGLTPVPLGQRGRNADRFWSPRSMGEIDPVKHWNTELQERLGKTPQGLAVLTECSRYGPYCGNVRLAGENY